MTLVFNASPLIVLAKAGLLDQILPLASRIYIPRPVALEIARFDSPSDAACAWLKTAVAQRSIVDAVEAIISAGLFISRRHIAEILKKAGE